MALVKKRPRFGIAFSGGGMRGVAELGAWKALQDAGIPRADMVAGTSAGFIVACCYALGLNCDDIYQRACEITPGFFRNYTLPQGALREKVKDLVANRSRVFTLQHDSSKVEALCREIFGDASFSDCTVPVYGITADLNTGLEVVMDSGNLAFAARASSAVPGWFSPVVDGERILVDGGVVNSLPADVLRKNGMQVVLGVDILIDKYTAPQSTKYIDVIGAYIELASHHGKVKNRSLCDVLVSPDLSEYPELKFNAAHAAAIFEEGYRAMEEKIPALRALLEPRGWLSLPHWLGGKTELG